MKDFTQYSKIDKGEFVKPLPAEELIFRLTGFDLCPFKSPQKSAYSSRKVRASLLYSRRKSIVAVRRAQSILEPATTT